MLRKLQDSSVILSWTSDQTPAGFVSVSGVPYFNNYVLRMSNKTLNSQYPYSRSNYEDVWTSTESHQTTTSVTNLSSSTKYYFYILASDYFGGALSNIVEVQTLPSPTSSPTPTLSILELSWLMILPLFIFTLSIAVVVRFRKTHRITRH